MKANRTYTTGLLLAVAILLSGLAVSCIDDDSIFKTDEEVNRSGVLMLSTINANTRADD